MGGDALTRIFKYSLISDMHIDHPQPKTPYDKLEKNIIVAGDTSNGLEGLKFLQKLGNKGHNVYACEGNHEHYANMSQGRTHKETADRFREEYPAVVDIDDRLTLININGWYPVTAQWMWYRYMNDCKYCFNVDANRGYEEVNSLAERHSLVVHHALLAAPGRKYIITTHTSPCEETLDPQYESEYSNQWYWNPFMREVLAKHKDKILIWNHGHTHASNEATVDGVRVVCNPRGYPGENPGWIPQTYEVEYE
jgi:UDP-2,3-diacylglucosamine pyrophosphatase LpxH